MQRTVRRLPSKTQQMSQKCSAVRVKKIWVSEKRRKSESIQSRTNDALAAEMLNRDRRQRRGPEEKGKRYGAQSSSGTGQNMAALQKDRLPLDGRRKAWCPGKREERVAS